MRSEDHTNLKEAVSSSEKDSSFTAVAASFEKVVSKTDNLANLHAYENPGSLDFAIGIAETYFSTEYWKSNLSSESGHIKEESEREENEGVCCVDQKTLEDFTVCREEKKTVAGNSVLQGYEETIIKSHTPVNSIIANLSIDDPSSPDCCDAYDFHSVPAIQDTEISHLISEVSLTEESDLSAVSALIDQSDVTNTQTDMTVVSSPPGINKQIFNIKPTHPPHKLTCDQNKMPDCKSSSVTLVELPAYSAPEVTIISTPGTTECSLYTIIHEASISPTSSHDSMGKLDCENTHHCVENTGTQSSCISPATLLKSDPKRKCRTNWESFSDSNSCFSDTSDLERTIFVPFPCANSAGSSLMEVDGGLQDLLITTYEYKREDMSQLASPLKLKHNQDTLYYNKTICEHLNNMDLHSANEVEDCKFKNEKGQYLPYPKYQSVDLLYNNYFKISDTQNELLNVSQTVNMAMNAVPLSSPATQKQPSPCKSKSLGDLTSEDISCNFESKYKYISRGFITSGMRDKMVATLKAKKPQTTDSLTEQLRKLVSFDQEDGCQSFCSKQNDDCPKMLVRKLSSRSQSRVRNIASRAKERQEASKQKLSTTSSSVSGVVLRNKASVPPHVINRHSTGSYIASYLDNFNADDVEGRGVPEGACTSLRFGYSDRFCMDDSLLESEPSEDDKPEIYFLLRL